MFADYFKIELQSLESLIFDLSRKTLCGTRDTHSKTLTTEVRLILSERKDRYAYPSIYLVYTFNTLSFLRHLSARREILCTIDNFRFVSKYTFKSMSIFSSLFREKINEVGLYCIISQNNTFSISATVQFILNGT